MKNQIVNGNTLFSILAVVLMVFAVQGVTFAQEEPPLRPFTFEVTLTNLTEGAPGQAGQVFSPPFIVTHAPRERFVQMGESASDELRILAEDGANGPIAVLAEGLDFVLDVLALDGPLPPGESVTVMILGGPGGPHLSLYQIWINRLLIRRRSPLSLILEKELVAFRSGTGISHDAGSNQRRHCCGG